METRRRQRQPTEQKPKPTSPPVVTTVPSRRAPATTTATDSFLLRTTQLIVLLGIGWFVYLIGSMNAIISSVNNNGGGIRSAKVQQINDVPFMGIDRTKARKQIQSLRNEFYNRYGGEEEALAMLKRGVQTFGSSDGDLSSSTATFQSDSLKGTALRFLSLLLHHSQSQSTKGNNSKEQSLPQFIFSFGGYSVTVGRGNHLTQSFPYIFQSITRPLLQSIQIDLVVRNAAIGGIPSFPYGWCLSNFLGKDSHGISWDYGMNEGNGGLGLESYLRHGMTFTNSKYNPSPMFVMVDNKPTRKNVLNYYVDKGYLIDPLILGRADVAVRKEVLKLSEEKRPIGLQKWEEWGAPKGAPGQSPWHPKKMEHELMGWMLAMYFVEAVEVALGIMEGGNDDWKETLLHDEMYQHNKDRTLPPPTTDGSGSGVLSLLHGVKNQNNEEEWTMPPVSCRTSFLPNLSGHLESIIVSGVTKDDTDMIQPRNDALFNTGWVMDVGKVERETKEKVNKYGGLGYIDMKTALYGIPSSGILKLWLPYEGSSHTLRSNDRALDYFQSVVFCEVNEKRGDKECNMISDLEFHIGGTTISKQHVKQIKGVASYLKKDICIHVDIPTDAKITEKDGRFGLDVEVAVVNSQVSRENGACSISHVIWQHVL